MQPRNMISQATPARMPRTPPFYVRDKFVAPANPEYARSLAAKAKSRSLGAEEVKQYGLDFLRRRKVVKGFFYSTDVSPFPVAANGTATAVVTFNKEAWFECFKISAVVDVPALGLLNVRGDDFLFRLRKGASQRVLSNNFIHNLAGTGSNIFPFVLPQPIGFDPSSALFIEMQNRRAQQINVHWNFAGKNFYQREYENLTMVPDFTALSKQEKEFFVASQKKFIIPYSYTLDATSVVLGAGATVTGQQITIRQEGDFEVFGIVGFSDAPFMVSMLEGNTGRRMTASNRAGAVQPAGSIASGLIMGDGERPYLFSESYWLDSNSNVELSFTNLDAVNPNTVFFTLIGRLWVDGPSQNLVAGADFFFDKYRAVNGG